jgi:hypothetical protein
MGGSGIGREEEDGSVGLRTGNLGGGGFLAAATGGSTRSFNVVTDDVREI